MSNRKSMLFLLSMVLAGSLFILIYLALTGNDAQAYTDIIIEFTAMYSSNKSAECRLIYLLIFGGLAVFAVYFAVSCRKQKKEACAVKEEEKDSGARMILCLFGGMAGTSFFVSSSIHPVLLSFLLVMLLLLLVDRTLAVHGFVFFYVWVYAVYGLYRLYVFAGGERSMQNMSAALAVSGIFLLALLFFQNHALALQRGSLLAQLLVPAVLLVYTSSKYKYNGTMMELPVPVSVRVFVYLLCALFVGEAVFLLRKNWHTDRAVHPAVSFGTCACIMAFQRFSGTGAVIPDDMHHPFENIIGYSQIFEMGQKPFSEYIPVSGMYSVVQGAVFQLFGNGEMGNYYITLNIFYLLVILLIIALLRAQMDSISVFAVSLVFLLYEYNRNVLILPVMLLLVMPKLTEHKNLWLKAWFLTSLFHGLYYPVYGAAVCIAFLPLGICQIREYAESGQLKSDIRTVKFWAGWGICLVPAVLCIPCLAGTYRHIRAMSGQTVCSEGIARFGERVPDGFFPYLGNYPLFRIALYDIFTFLIPAGFVWAAFALAVKAGETGWFHGRLKMQNKKAFAAVISLAVMPCICYSFTFVQLDPYSVYVRNAGVLYAGISLLFVLVQRYLNGQKICCLLFCLTGVIAACDNGVGIYHADSKLSAYQTVPDGYVYTEDDRIERFGKCFVEPAMYDSAEAVYDEFLHKDREQSYFGKPEWFGYFYLCGIKGDGVMEAGVTVKGYGAAQEAIETVRKNKTRIGTGMGSFTQYGPFVNYYLYHWLLTSGEYLWSEEEGCFLLNETGMPAEAVWEKHKNLMLFADGLDTGKCAGSLGLSLDSLQKVLSVRDVEYTLQETEGGLIVGFADGLDGDEADYLYLEFPGMDRSFRYTLYDLNGEQEQEAGIFSRYLMKKDYNPGMQVTAAWQDENGNTHTMHCAMHQGKLLVPLGAGSGWLLNRHVSLDLTAVQDGQQIKLPEVSRIQFFKLREAG